jgi:hypothetical protein
MKWRGLTAESKLFCGYAAKSPGDKAKWWVEYLLQAAPKFWWYTMRDKVRYAYVRWRSDKA